uniref:DNA-directed DNA polymerase n=1 Tax=Macrostomum lignano TaxID=282301 RepID=A0A1I8ITE4_9PLAT
LLGLGLRCPTSFLFSLSSSWPSVDLEFGVLLAFLLGPRIGRTGPGLPRSTPNRFQAVSRNYGRGGMGNEKNGQRVTDRGGGKREMPVPRGSVDLQAMGLRVELRPMRELENYMGEVTDTPESAQTPGAITRLPCSQWYRDLVPKPVEKNAAQGASLITAQMRVAPKLLRLTWRGFPLHHDSELKWGRLVPGRNPSPAEVDPRYFNPDNSRLLSDQPAIKTVAAGSSELRFPLAAYCRACLPSLLRCLRQHELLDQQQQRRRQRQAWWRRFSADLAGSLRMLPVDEIGRAELEAALTAMESGAAGDDGEGGREAGKEEYDWERHLPCALTATPLAEGAAFKRAANPSIDACWFCALPHPQGTSVGNPLSKSFLAAIDAGLLCSDRPEVGELLRMHARCTYWQGASKRVNSQLALPLVHGGEGGGIRLILPQVVAMGTVSRRAVEPLWLTASNARPDRLGSELKAMVQPPPGYRLVGADVDSQELWIASMAGDAEFDDDAGGGNGERRRIHGATAVSWMSLRGSKAEGTDLHSVSARLINVSREHAKVLNYARFYGSGAGNIAKLLCQFDPGIDKQLAMDKARKLLRETKGSRSGGVWRGGSESFLFNHMERIAGLQSPRTPFLGAALSCALRAGSTGGDFATSRINWVIQSSAVDYLHCLLVACRWLTAKYGIDARFAISIHDEVRYLVRDSDTMRFALALQLANLLTRAFFASRLGFRDLPQSVAFFSGVDIDSCMRKDPLDDCVTPSNSAGLRLEYGIEPGVTLDIEKILQATGGRLDNIVKPSAQGSGGQTTPLSSSSCTSWHRLVMCGASGELRSNRACRKRGSVNRSEQVPPDHSQGDGLAVPELLGQFLLVQLPAAPLHEHQVGGEVVEAIAKLIGEGLLALRQDVVRVQHGDFHVELHDVLHGLLGAAPRPRVQLHDPVDGVEGSRRGGVDEDLHRL